MISGFLNIIFCMYGMMILLKSSWVTCRSRFFAQSCRRRFTNNSSTNCEKRDKLTSIFTHALYQTAFAHLQGWLLEVMVWWRSKSTGKLTANQLSVPSLQIRLLTKYIPQPTWSDYWSWTNTNCIYRASSKSWCSFEQMAKGLGTCL